MNGDADEGYGKVVDAFRCNFESGAEIGAAVAVYRDGRKVVDLWDGCRDGRTREQWQQDTIVTVFDHEGCRRAYLGRRRVAWASRLRRQGG